MSLLGINILSDAALEHLKAAGHEVATVALTDTARAVAALKTTEVGKAVVSDIQTIASTSLTGTQKFEQVVANTLPLIMHLATAPGRVATIDQVKDLGRELVQSLFNDVRSSLASTAATAVLAAIAGR